MRVSDAKAARSRRPPPDPGDFFGCLFYPGPEAVAVEAETDPSLQQTHGKRWGRNQPPLSFPLFFGKEGAASTPQIDDCRPRTLNIRSKELLGNSCATIALSKVSGGKWTLRLPLQGK